MSLENLGCVVKAMVEESDARFKIAKTFQLHIRDCLEKNDFVNLIIKSLVYYFGPLKPTRLKNAQARAPWRRTCKSFLERTRRYKIPQSLFEQITSSRRLP